MIELIQYKPTGEQTHARPLLIFPPWINKFYILDLREENSMIRWLLDKGLSVFVVSWRSADEVTRDYTWNDYVKNGIYAAVEATLQATGQKGLNTVGYCIGAPYSLQPSATWLPAATTVSSQPPSLHPSPISA